MFFLRLLPSHEDVFSLIFQVNLLILAILVWDRNAPFLVRETKVLVVKTLVFIGIFREELTCPILVIFQGIQGLRSLLLFLNLLIVARSKVLTSGHIRVIEVIIRKDFWRVSRLRMSTRVKLLLLGGGLLVLTLLLSLGCLYFFKLTQFGRVVLVEARGGWARIQRCKWVLFRGQVLIRVFCVHLTVFAHMIIHAHLAGRKRLQHLRLLLMILAVLGVVGRGEIEIWR